ncbi:hypothetical protein SDC9_201796 [bioreactor metagenome]|uniref:Uncharacterized protein n=1 Tax=bioreactor metagenome TaxID=1076179 RepID=A0A645ISC6_9ZZZZ
MMLNRFHHVDGVIDNQADGQNHGEQGQCVNRKS